MEWINDINSILALITGLCGLIGTAIGTYYAVKNFILILKEKNKSEVWGIVMAMADAAMKEAEESGKAGADKKQMAMNAVKAACKAAGLNIDDFIDQLSDYIDNTIQFVNDMDKLGI